MILTTMTAAADAAAQRYKDLIDAWRGLFMRALDASNFGSAATVRELVDQAYAMARAYQADEEDRLAHKTTEIALEAHRATLDALRSTDARELTDATDEHLSELERFIRSEIAIQIERDIAFLRQSYLRVVLQVKIAARSQRTTMRAALLQYRIGNAVELGFYFHDRRNQRWPSQKFIRAIWRQHLLCVYNETVLIDLAEHNQRVARIEHTDPNSDFHNMRVALSANTALPTYAEIRNEIFHPNSEALLAPSEAA